MKINKPKILFVGFPFYLEGLYTKSDANNGYISYSLSVLEELEKYFNITVVTDKPSFFKNHSLINFWV